MNRRQLLQLSLLFATTARGCSSETDAGGSAHTPYDPKTDPDRDKQQILMLVYPKMTILDLIGPQHVFCLLGPEFKTRLVWKNTDEIVSDTGVPIRPTLAFKDCSESPVVLFIPGGTDGTLAAMADPEVREFVTSRGAKATYVTSVCTGSLVLRAAGLLDGYKATTHWLSLEDLHKFGAEPIAERVVEDRNRITGAGVTAGIDFALTLAAKLKDESYAKSVQLMMEYDPQPPFQSGNTTNADPESVEILEAMTKPFHSMIDDTIERIQEQSP